MPWGRLGRGLALAALGGAMLRLALAENYWMFLNPRFQWLTGGTGLALVLLGLALALARGRRSTAPGAAVMVLMAALALGAQQASLPKAPEHTPLTGPTPAQEAAQAIAPRITIDGLDYVRLNLAELLVGAMPGSDIAPPERVAVRGMVVRTPEMDARGEFALVRVHIVCCLADAVGVGFVVRHAGAPPAAGAWIEARATLEPLGAGPAPQVLFPGVIGVLLGENHALAAASIQPVDPPEVPFIFILRDREPFAY
jgi:hypothetical protein